MSIHISGAAANQNIADRQTIRPFAGVVVTDDSAQAAESVTITMSDAGNGSFWNLAGADDTIYLKDF